VGIKVFTETPLFCLRHFIDFSSVFCESACNENPVGTKFAPTDTNLRKSRRQPSEKAAALGRFSRSVGDDDFRD